MFVCGIRLHNFVSRLRLSRLYMLRLVPNRTFFLFSIPYPHFHCSSTRDSFSQLESVPDLLLKCFYLNPWVHCYLGLDFPIHFSLITFLSVSLCLPRFFFSYMFLSFSQSSIQLLKQSTGVLNYFTFGNSGSDVTGFLGTGDVTLNLLFTCTFFTTVFLVVTLAAQ